MEPIPPYLVIDQMIAEAAYYKWDNAGRPPDRTLFFWVEAEKEIWEKLLKDRDDL